MIALDTNLLIYADTPGDPYHRNAAAFALIEKLTVRAACIPLQVLSEFLNVCRHKKMLDFDLAAERVHAYAQVFATPPTALHDLAEANRLSKDYNLQYFDALILAVSARAGATMLLSEDMQDGLEVGGLRIVNPFLAANDGLISDYFANS